MKPTTPPDFFRHLHVPTADEIIGKVLNRFPRLKPSGKRTRQLISFEVNRLDLVYQIVRDKMAFLDRLPKPEDLHPFYVEMASLVISPKEYWASVVGLKKARRKIEEIWEDYRIMIKTAPSLEEARRLRKEGVGRILSMVKRGSRAFDNIKRFRDVIAKMPSVNFDEPRIVIAGMPSTGKSTLVSLISTVKPEVASYPFTTKDIHLGHFTFEGGRFQIIDTPGILDRPFERMNEIERKALTAIKYLPSSLIFLFDPTKESYSVKEQIEVFDNVRELIGDRKIIAVINKIDAADKEKINEIEEELFKRGFNALRVSLATKEGLRELVEVAAVKALENLGEGGQWYRGLTGVSSLRGS